MKKTINKKVYDTTTATELASDSYGYASDFNHWVEKLYRTKRGNYFLYGRGGASSRYGRSCGNNSCGGGSDIIPMTREEALDWCERHECQDAIDKHFTDLVELA